MKFPTLSALHKHAVTVHSLSGYLQAKAKENAFCAPCAIAFPNSALYAEHFVLFHADNGHHRSKMPVSSFLCNGVVYIIVRSVIFRVKRIFSVSLCPNTTREQKVISSFACISESIQSSIHCKHFSLFHVIQQVCSPEPLQVKPTDLSKKSKSSSSIELPSSSTSSGVGGGMSHHHHHHHLGSSGSAAKKLKREDDDMLLHNNSRSSSSGGSLGITTTGCATSSSTSISASDIRSSSVAAAAAAAAAVVAAHSTNNNNINPIMSLVGAPVLLCSQCNAGFSDFESFRTHLKSHLEEIVQKFVCEECDSEFNTEDQLENHSLVHYMNTSTEYGCQSCLKLFSKPDELQKHLMDIHAHHLYRCALCKEMFDSKVSIQVHFAVKHSNECKLFRCNSCSNIFRSEIEFQVGING